MVLPGKWRKKYFSTSDFTFSASTNKSVVNTTLTVVPSDGLGMAVFEPTPTERRLSGSSTKATFLARKIASILAGLRPEFVSTSIASR